MALVKCAYCGSQTVDKKSKDYVQYNGKNYHLACAEKQKEKESFYKYTCFVLGLKAPGPRIYSQAKNFMEKYGYSYADMEMALRYLYEVKKHKDNYAIEDKTIGLIPYIYEEASNYYQNIEKKIEKLKTNEQILKEREKIVVVKLPTKKDRKVTYDINDY